MLPNGSELFRARGRTDRSPACATHVTRILSWTVRELNVVCHLGYRILGQWPNTQAKTSGATIVASLSITNFGVDAASFPHVIFSFGTAPE